jgi:hypothetical protein
VIAYDRVNLTVIAGNAVCFRPELVLVHGDTKNPQAGFGDLDQLQPERAGRDLQGYVGDVRSLERMRDAFRSRA